MADEELLAKRLELLELGEKKRAILEETRRPEAKAWWVKATELLALPTAIIVLVFQFTQTAGELDSQEKIQAETAKIQAEEIKTRAETEKLLDEIAEKKGKGVEEYRKAIEDTLPKLQETLGRLDEIENRSRSSSSYGILLKFVLLWIIYNAIGLLFDIIAHVWAALLNSITMVSLSYSPSSDRKNERARKASQLLQKVLPWFHTIAGPIPDLFRWSIHLSVFIVLVIPLFDEAVTAIAGTGNFQLLVDTVKDIGLGEAISLMRQLMFGAH